MPSDLELAYSAGVMDSDGYFSIGRKRGKVRVSDGVQPYYFDLKVGCNQIADTVPLFLASIFGGAVWRCEPEGRSGGWWSWNVNSQQAGRAAEQLLPLLRLKRRQAETAVEFCALLRGDRHRVGNSFVVSPEMEKRRNVLYGRMRTLNAIGGRGKEFDGVAWCEFPEPSRVPVA